MSAEDTSAASATTTEEHDKKNDAAPGTSDDRGADDDDGEVLSRANPYGNNNYKKPNQYRPPQLSAEQRKFQKEFMMIDIDNNGFVDKTDLKKIFRSVVPETMLDKVIKFIDTNKDGKISLQEYTTIRKLLGNIPMPTFGKKDDDDDPPAAGNNNTTATTATTTGK